MASLKEQPPVGFTAADLATLRSIYPLGQRHPGPAADVFAVPRRGQGMPWLIVSRQKDGSYVSIDPLKGTRVARWSLADLPLE
jgi:hypothetical protein